MEKYNLILFIFLISYVSFSSSQKRITPNGDLNRLNQIRHLKRIHPSILQNKFNENQFGNQFGKPIRYSLPSNLDKTQDFRAKVPNLPTKLHQIPQKGTKFVRRPVISYYPYKRADEMKSNASDAESIKPGTPNSDLQAPNLANFTSFFPNEVKNGIFNGTSKPEDKFNLGIVSDFVKNVFIKLSNATNIDFSQLLADGFGFEKGPPAPLAVGAAIGGIQSFQALMRIAPLSPLGFAKLFVAILPFTVTLIFVPLFMFGIGVLLIPITRFHYYIDSQMSPDAQEESGRFLHVDIDLDPDLEASPETQDPSSSRRFFNPNQFTFQNLVMRPLRRALSSHECVERFTCEFTTRMANLGLRFSGRQLVRNGFMKALLDLTDHKYIKYTGRVISTLKNSGISETSDCKKYCCNPSRMLFEQN